MIPTDDTKCCPHGFASEPGWDPASGLGGLRFVRLYELLTSRNIDDQIRGQLAQHPPTQRNSNSHRLLVSTKAPTQEPTTRPTARPTISPTTEQPSGQPTRQPTKQPSGQPTRQPTKQPSGQPTRQPTKQPSGQPTGQPTTQPTNQPSSDPTTAPSSYTECSVGGYVESGVCTLVPAGKSSVTVLVCDSFS